MSFYRARNFYRYNMPKPLVWSLEEPSWAAAQREPNPKTHFYKLAAVAILSSLFTLGAVHLSAGPQTSTGHSKAVGEKAFMLIVGLRFSDDVSAKSLLAAWSVAASYCLNNEPFLYAYEAAQSDKDNLSYVILERYRSKEDYLGAHRKSIAFKEFRPKMRALQDAGKVIVSGSSYYELGIGFT
jgi:quinol monooxygenase YgiN